MTGSTSPHSDRRTFLKQAAGTAIGAGLGARSYGRVLGANDRIAIAQFGCGSHGFSHTIVCIMAAQSYWSGKRLYWNPHTEEIVDQPVKHS